MLKEKEDPTHSQLHAEILRDPLTIQIGDGCDSQLLHTARGQQAYSRHPGTFE